MVKPANEAGLVVVLAAAAGMQESVDAMRSTGATQVQPGMGQFVTLWLTGDPAGFGTISPSG